MSTVQVRRGSVEPDTSTETTAETLFARARALIPELQARSVEDAANRQIRQETIDDIDAAGLWRCCQPKRWGGYGLMPSDSLEILRILGYADLSVAWISGIYAGHNLHLGHFDEQAQADVWGENPHARIVSPYAPDGRATPVPGGFRLTGHWRYSSGSIHSNWAMIGGLVMSENGPPEYRVFLLPRSDYEVVDTWDVVGLEATGSNDLKVDDVFVPAYRTLQNRPAEDFSELERVGNNTPAHRIPYYQVAFRYLSTGQIGALEAMADIFAENTRMRYNQAGQRVAQDPDAMSALVRAKAGISEMRTVLKHSFDVMEGHARNDSVASVEDRMLFRFQSATCAQNCAELADKLFLAAGGNALLRSRKFERIYRDILAARAHFGNNAQMWGRKMAGVLMGAPVEPTDFQF